MANSGGNRQAVTVNFDDAEVQAFLDELGEAASEEVRPAAQAGAQILYNEVRVRCPVSDGAHTFYGTHSKYLFPAGTLRDSIYQVFSKDNSNEKKATYHIAWNHQKAPYGFMVEFGTSRAPAHPFLRPAYDAQVQNALNTTRDVYITRMEAKLQELKA